jgi:hypothetical protein
MATRDDCTGGPKIVVLVVRIDGHGHPNRAHQQDQGQNKGGDLDRPWALDGSRLPDLELPPCVLVARTIRCQAVRVAFHTSGTDCSVVAAVIVIVIAIVIVRVLTSAAKPAKGLVDSGETIVTVVILVIVIAIIFVVGLAIRVGRTVTRQCPVIVSLPIVASQIPRSDSELIVSEGLPAVGKGRKPFGQSFPLVLDESKPFQVIPELPGLGGGTAAGTSLWFMVDDAVYRSIPFGVFVLHVWFGTEDFDRGCCHRHSGAGCSGVFCGAAIGGNAVGVGGGDDEGVYCWRGFVFISAER